MDDKLSRKRYWRAFSVITLVYIILQILIFFFDDGALSRRLWIEHRGNRQLEELGKPESSGCTPLIKQLSNHHFWILRAAVVSSLFFALYYRKRDEKRYTLFKSIFLSALLILVLVSGVLTWVLKLSIGKPRPSSGLTQFMPLSLSTKYHSFPSGHTTETFSYIVPFIYFLRKHLVTVLLLVYGVALSFTRVILAYHFITDVLFGIYITVVSGIVICSYVERHYGSR
jgi:membrane-associated phospholipid phosphatase